MNELKTYANNDEPTTTTWEQVHQAAGRIQLFFQSVRGRFVERDTLIRNLKYALLLREHVLIYGPPGTAKTAIADTIVQNIRGAQSWRYDFSRFTAETQVYGDFDIKHAQETGELMHRTEGSILKAHFANLGELLDSNTALLRSLLRVLNEREFLRGPQHLKAPLMTAIANTNINPLEAIKKNDELAAVLDRFLFWEPVRYVAEPENRLRMLKLFLERAHGEPLPPLGIEDVQLVSGVALRMNLLYNDFILQAYEEMTREFAQRRGRPVTDRRLNKGVQILMVSAILDGAWEVRWEDLARAQLVLVDHPDDEPHFLSALQESQRKWMDSAHQALASKEELTLNAFEARLSSAPIEMMMEAELVQTKRQLLTLDQDLRAFRTSTPAVAAKKTTLLGRVSDLLRLTQNYIDLPHR